MRMIRISTEVEIDLDDYFDEFLEDAMVSLSQTLVLDGIRQRDFSKKLLIFCKKYILSLRAYTITHAVLIQQKKTGGSIMIPPVFFIYLSGRSLAEFDEYASSQRHISHHLIFTCSIRIHRIDNSSQKS